jgi:uncharacterized phage-associated protein
MDPDKLEKQERLLEATVALLESAPGHRMQITNLNKALFYLDLAALRDTGKTITGNRYLALDQGPVLDGYKDNLIPALTSAKLARQDVEGMSQPVVLTKSLESYRYLDDHLRGLALRVAEKIATETASSVSDLSHKNPGWIMAYEQGQKQGLPPVAINMLIAMQQVVERDKWLDTPASKELEDIFGAADIHQGDSW